MVSVRADYYRQGSVASASNQALLRLLAAPMLHHSR